MLVTGGQMRYLLEREEEDESFKTVWDEMEELEPSMPDEPIVTGIRAQIMELPHGQGPGTSSVSVPRQIAPHPRNKIPEEDTRVMEEVGCELCSV